MASQTITGQGLQFTQDNRRCYAYNTVDSNQIAQTVLEFTTGSGYILFEAYFTGPTKFDDPNTGREANWQISLNGVVIATAHTDTSESEIVQQGQLKFIAPPFTTVKIENDANDDSASYINAAVLTGRVYEYLPVRD